MTFKIVLLGDSSVGKTSLLYRFSDDQFFDKTSPTIGMAFCKKTIERKNMKITLEIWDTAGQEKFKKIAPIYYRNAQAVLIVFDLCKLVSFESAKKWLEEVEKFLTPDCTKYIVGNKLDVCQYFKFRNVVEEFIQSNNLNFIETSAKSGYNVHRLFRRVARSLAKNKLRKMENIEQKSIIKLQIQVEEEKKLQKQNCCYTT